MKVKNIFTKLSMAVVLVAPLVLTSVKTHADSLDSNIIKTGMVGKQSTFTTKDNVTLPSIPDNLPKADLKNYIKSQDILDLVLSFFTSKKTLNQSDLDGITMLSGWFGNGNESYGTNVKSLDGAQYLHNVTELTIHDNPYLTQADYNYLKGLPKLAYIDAPNNTGMTDIDFVKDLPALKSLRIGGASISTLAPLADLHVKSGLTISAPYTLKDGASLSALSGLQCDYLDLSGNGVTDKQLRTLIDGMDTNIKTLMLNKNEITDVTPLSKLDDRVKLSLDENHILDLQSLGAIDGVTITANDQTVKLPDAKVNTPTSMPVGYNIDKSIVSMVPNATKSDYSLDTSRNTITWNSVGQKTFTFSGMDNFTGTVTQDVVKDLTAAPVTVKYQDESGKTLAPDFKITGNVGDTYNVEKKVIDGYTFKEIQGSASGTLSNDAKTVVIIYTKSGNPVNPITPPVDQSQSVTAHYVDENGHKIANDEVLTGKLGTTYQTKQKEISGYTFDKANGNTNGFFTKEMQEVTYIYKKNNTTNPIVKKGTVVYALKKIGLYSQKNFSNKARKVWYHQKSRIDRPMFVVTGYATSKNNHLRYQVKDVNHHSKTSGLKGYISANSDYTAPVYYASVHKTVTVINPQGVNVYSQKSLTGKSVHYKQGQVLKVKKIVKHNLTTRFVLTNGKYVTANKKLMIAGKYQMPTKVRAKTAINRYKDVNLTKRNRHYSKRVHQTFKVLGWDYSHESDFSHSSTLRYRVAGGYITANSKFVKAMK